MDRVPTVDARPGAAISFLQKATEFAAEAQDALDRGRLQAAASLACHAVISGADALLAKRRGIRSKDPSHEGGLRLVAALPMRGAPEKAAAAAKVLEIKHRAEYDDRGVTRREADDAVKRAARFLAWVEEALGSSR